MGTMALLAIPLFYGKMHIGIPPHLLAHLLMTFKADRLQGGLDMKGIVGRMGIVADQALAAFKGGMLFLRLHSLKELLVAGLARFTRGP